MLQSTSFNTIRTQQAIHLFREMKLRGWLHRLWSRLTRKALELTDLNDTMCCAEVQNSHYAGIHAVNIAAIRGTVGKADAFDDEFNPLKENTLGRWLSIALEKICGCDLPPVDLIDVDGVYFVRDGHHRISVARSLGQAYIEAEITVLNLSRRVM